MNYCLKTDLQAANIKKENETKKLLVWKKSGMNVSAWVEMGAKGVRWSKILITWQRMGST